MIDLSKIRFRVEKGTLLTEVHAAILLTNKATVSNQDMKNARDWELLFNKAQDGLKLALWDHVYGEVKEAASANDMQKLAELLSIPK